MTLSDRLREYVQACFTAIWIESFEHQDALAELATLCREEDWRLVSWNIESGLNVAGMELDTQASDPLAALRALPSLAMEDGTVILVLQNFHRFLQSAEIV
ncbi:MAG: AAA family ATPase, partial [Planctomycetota bacterium]|nr:AAA family ATPase [Planctomycetota bacterium]